MTGTPVRRGFSVSLILIIAAIICFVVAALGIASKLGFGLEDLGLAFFAASFIF